MLLIVYYLIFMIAGDFAAYFIGLAVEYEWGSQASLIVFLVLYFLFLWVSWVLAVWMTKPRGVTQSASYSAGTGGLWYSTVTLRFRASDSSRVDMKAGLRELTALSLLVGLLFWSCVGSRRHGFRRCFWQRHRNHDYRGDTTFAVVRCPRAA